MNDTTAEGLMLEAGLILQVTGTSYELTLLPPTPFRPWRFHVHKAGVAGHGYEVSRSCDGRVSCGCPWWTNRGGHGDGVRPCRHIKALIAVGLMPAGK